MTIANEHFTEATTDTTRIENRERTRIIRNTKLMEDNLIHNNLDLNQNELEHCRDKDGNPTTFISSRTQEQVIHKIMAATTKSVMDSDKYDGTDNSVARAKRIYSRKKENIKLITTIFNNGGHMVKYFKYATKSGNVLNPEVGERHVRNFINRLRDAYRNAEVIEQEGKRMLKLPKDFSEALVKLNIAEEVEVLKEDFQFQPRQA